MPTSGLKRAERFYEAVLGLEVERGDEARGVYYRAGGGTMLNLYEREHELAGHAVATFLVEDIERAMGHAPRSRRVVRGI